MNAKLSIIFVLVLFLFTFTSCFKSEYQQLEERELATGVRQDSLFLGIYFGMMSKDFFAHCWQLNKEQLITQGGANMTVQYKLQELKFPASMEFYPSFREDRIYELPVWFYYDGWLPGIKERSADSLKMDVVRLLEKWYGEGFIEVKHPGKYPAHVKVDGNRRILVAREDDRKVKVIFTDLYVKKKMEEDEQLAETQK